MSSLTGKSLNPVMNRRSVIASAAGLGAMSILAGCSSNGGDSGSASSDASFKVGTIGPLTGANASYGKSVTQGVELGCKDFSTKELPLASKAEDDQADGEKAVNAFNTLLDWGMQALVGPTTTGASVAVAAECGNDPKTFMITPSASSEDCHRRQGLRLPGLLHRPQPGCQRCQVPGAEVSGREVRAVL